MDCSPEKSARTKLPTIRTVYTVQIKEVISYDYKIVAKSPSEAKRIATEFNYDCDDHHFNSKQDCHGFNSKIDGSHQYHKMYNPTIEKVEIEHYIIEEREFSGESYEYGEWL